MIVQFYATAADGGTRSELLKKKGLFGGQSRQLTIADGSDACVYKIRAVFENDSFYDVRDEIDFCESDTIRYRTDRSMVAAAPRRSREILVGEEASRLKAPLRPIKDTGSIAAMAGRTGRE